MPVHTLADDETLQLVCWAYGVPKETLRAIPDNHGLGDHPAAGTRVTIPEEFASEPVSVAPGSAAVTLHEGRIRFIQRAYHNAFGENVRSFPWRNRRWSEIRPILGRVYRYYGATYQREPGLFLWAGLGKLAGATVIKGVDSGSIAFADDDLMVQTMGKIAKEIFWDVTWLHEAALDDFRAARVLATQYDARRFRVRSDGAVVPARYAAARDAGVRVPDSRYAYRFGDYGRAISYLIDGSQDGPYYGNLAMLANEQWVNIQPWYDMLHANGYRSILGRAGYLTRSVHPYHDDFAVSGRGQISDAPDRWRWINDSSNAMWTMWANLPESERNRLVAMSMQTLMNRDWGPTLPAYEPPGTRY